MEVYPTRAATNIVISMALLGLIDTYVVRIAEGTSLWQFHVMRSLMAVPMIVIIARVLNIRVMPYRMWAVSARSLLMATAMMGYFGSLAFIPVGIAAAGLFTSPIWILLITVVFLGRRIGPVRIVAVALGFTGILLVFRPWENGLTTLTVVPVLAGMIYAMSALATREWCEGETWISLLAGVFIANGLWGLAGMIGVELLSPESAEGAAGFITRGALWPESSILLLTLMQAVFSVVAVAFLIRGYQLGEASFVAVFEYSILVFAALWAYLLFGQTLDAMAMVGMATITVAGSLIALRGRQQPQSQ